jgi:serine/threonine protein kinase
MCQVYGTMAPVPGMNDVQPADPSTIGEYRVLNRLGSGSQGVVYLAATPSGERVAIKQLLRSGPEDEQARQQFAKEVAAARRVAAFCTAQLLDVQLEGPMPYLVSEYIEGPSLHQKISHDGPMAGPTLQRMAVGTVTALAAIHQAGVVHRDFKPANVMLSSEGPRVIDFGIARDLSAETTITSRIFGTPAFMSPEQLRNEPVGPAADMFAWASVVAYAATGRAPFEADQMMAVAYRITHGEPTLAEVPAALLGVLERCLEKDSSRRPTAQQALALLLDLPDPENDPAPAGQLLARGSRVAEPAGGRGRKALASLLAGLLVCLLAVGGWALARSRGSDRSDRSERSEQAAQDLGARTPSPAGVTAATESASTGPATASDGPPTGRRPTPAKTARAPGVTVVPVPATPAGTPTKKPVADQPAPTPSASRTGAPGPTAVVIPSATGTGSIVGIAGKCLDIANARSSDGTVVQISTCNESKAQIWTAGRDGTIQALGKCLNAGLAAITISTCDGSGAQAWRIASGTVVNTGSGNCLAPLGGLFGDRTPVVVSACSGAASQAWSLRS